MGRLSTSKLRYVGKIIRYCPVCDRRKADCICKVTKWHGKTEAKTEAGKAKTNTS